MGLLYVSKYGVGGRLGAWEESTLGLATVQEDAPIDGQQEGVSEMFEDDDDGDGTVGCLSGVGVESESDKW